MVDLDKLTSDELEQLKCRIEAKQKEDSVLRSEQIDAYKQLVDEAVTAAFGRLQAESRRLAETKRDVYAMFDSALALKKDLFKKKGDGQWSHNFTNADCTRRIVLGSNTLDNYDDTAQDGIDMVNEYLDTLADTPRAEQAVSICRSLMARDKKGNLKPGKIVTLYSHAKKSGDSRFLEGVELIMNAYHPVASKTYIRAEYKNEKGEWVNVPLGMTEAE